jgi:hypothetical protein
VVRHAHADRVEERVVHELEPAVAQPAREDRRQPVHALGDQLEAFATVVDRVHRGHHGEQHLRRADIRRGLLAADVLLAGLESEAQRRVAVGIDREADEAARQRALEPAADAHVGGVRAAEADRDAEALRRADDDIRPHLARRLEQHEREQVGRGAEQRALCMRRLGERLEIAHEATRARILREHAEAPARRQARGEVGLDDLDAERLGARLERGERLREEVEIDREAVGRGLRDASRDGHRLGGRGGLVEQRRVRERQPREVADHRLVVQERLEASLGDLRLVRRVGRVPGRILEHLAQHDLGRVRAVVAETDHRRHHPIAAPELAQLGQDVDLGQCLGQVQVAAQQDRRRHSGARELVERSVPEQCQQALLILGRGPDVTTREGDRALELGQPGHL